MKLNPLKRKPVQEVRAAKAAKLAKQLMAAIDAYNDVSVVPVDYAQIAVVYQNLRSRGKIQ